MANIPVTLDRNKTVTLKYVAPPPPPPPPTYRLTVYAYADGVSIGVSAVVDGVITIWTPGSQTFSEGTHTVTVPASVIIGGLTYNCASPTQAVLLNSDKTVSFSYAKAPTPPPKREPIEGIDYTYEYVPSGPYAGHYTTCKYCGLVYRETTKEKAVSAMVAHIKAVHPDKLV